MSRSRAKVRARAMARTKVRKITRGKIRTRGGARAVEEAEAWATEWQG